MANINEILNRDHRTTSFHKITVDQKFDKDEIENLDNCDKCQNESHSDKRSNHFAKSYTKVLRRSKLIFLRNFIDNSVKILRGK